MADKSFTQTFIPVYQCSPSKDFSGLILGVEANILLFRSRTVLSAEQIEEPFRGPSGQESFTRTAARETHLSREGEAGYMVRWVPA